MRILSYATVCLLVLVGCLVTFVSYWPSFGGSVSGDRLKRVQNSPHYQNDKFINPIKQSPRDFAQIWEVMKRQFTGTEQRQPPAPIPVIKIEPDFFTALPPAGMRTIWFGHASVYLEVDGSRLMIDPVLSDFTSPISGIGPKRFHEPPIPLEALPQIDAVLISHDHYDHLDMRTVQHLATNRSHFFVPLGVGSHLERWHIPREQVTELEWWESANVNNLKIVSTPARHYSGRGILDHKDTFWSSWSIIGPVHRAFYSGDTGFSPHFEKIGKQLGPFDLSIIKIGAYGPGPTWTDIHMPPEHAIQAHLALRAKRMLPVHWATFNLALHAWDEPIKRAVQAARKANVEMVTPRVGDLVTTGQHFASSAWWEHVK